MFASLRSQPERWLFTALITLMLAPVLAQGLDRPLASLLALQPGGTGLTASAIAVALAGWLLCAGQEQLHFLVAASLTALVAVGVALGLGSGPSSVLALVAVAVGAVGLARVLPARLPPALDGLLARHHLLALVYVVVALVSIVQVTRVSIFIADPSRTDAQIVPGVDFLARHSCLTAYVRANELAKDRVDNLYLAERWPNTVTVEHPPETPFSPFDIDEYFYPPPFLLLTEILAPLRGDFLAQRAAWFGLNGILLALGLWLGARGLGGVRWHRPLLLAPLFFASLTALSILQVGQAQAAVVVAAVLAMLAFEVDRPALGGFALALATMAKISPGIFGVILLVQRRWRAVAWTAGFGVALLLLTVIAYGTEPIVSWVTYTMPRLSSGEAFAPILQHPPSVAINLAPSGFPYLVGLFGVDVEDPWSIARRVNQVFTVLVVALAVVAGRRQRPELGGTRSARALGWMALLFLGSLRSPFAPAYVLFAFIWALTILSVEVETRRGGVGLFLLFVLVSVMPPISLAGQAVDVLVIQVVTITVASWMILRRPASPAVTAGPAGQPGTAGPAAPAGR